MSNRIELLNSILLIILLLFFIYILKIDILKIDDPYHNQRKVLKLNIPDINTAVCHPSDTIKILRKPRINTTKILNLFNNPETTTTGITTQSKKIPPKIQKKPKKIEKNYQRLLNQLAVNGVMKGKKPKAVIYNKRTGETSFVEEGDLLLNTFKVKSIKNNKIILEADNRNFFLKF